MPSSLGQHPSPQGVRETEESGEGMFPWSHLDEGTEGSITGPSPLSLTLLNSEFHPVPKFYWWFLPASCTVVMAGLLRTPGMAGGRIRDRSLEVQQQLIWRSDRCHWAPLQEGDRTQPHNPPDAKILCSELQGHKEVAPERLGQMSPWSAPGSDPSCPGLTRGLVRVSTAHAETKGLGSGFAWKFL